MTAPIRLGLVGLGVISRFYLSAIERSPAFTLAAVCDLDPDKLRPFESLGLSTSGDYRQLLENPAVDAVVINAPNDLHATLVADSLRAAKPVCCEKPLALHTRDAERLTALAEETSQTLFVAFHRRYNPHVTAALRDCSRDDPVVSLTCNYLERIEEHASDQAWYLMPNRCGGGCIIDNGSNVFDLLSRFADGWRVVAAAVTSRRHGAEYTSTLDLAGEKGVTARVNLSWEYPGEFKDLTLVFASGRTRHVNLLQEFDGFKASLWNEYEGVMSDFETRLRRGAGRGRDGLAVVRLVDQAYECITGVSTL